MLIRGFHTIGAEEVESPRVSGGLGFCVHGP